MQVNFLQVAGKSAAGGRFSIFIHIIQIKKVTENLKFMHFKVWYCGTLRSIYLLRSNSCEVIFKENSKDYVY